MAIARDPYVVIDAPDALVLAGFYAQLLDWQVHPGSDAGWAALVGPDGREICFQGVGESFRAPEWPGQEVPQQMHFDVHVDDLDEAEAATLAIGATKHEHQPGETFRVFLDPAGHPFCLCLANPGE